jgi:hypothetical protein
MVIRYASAVLTLAGIFALILGLLMWTGTTLNFISMHMLLGFLTVGALWVVGVVQAVAKAGNWGLAASALILGALTIVFGLYQSSMLMGDFHWVIQVCHLLLGVLTIGLGHMSAARYRKVVDNS